MPSIAVGTANPGKVLAVAEALKQYAALADYGVLPAKVDSGVSDQPMTMEETTQGASNRARKALEANKQNGASMGLGMESGLFESRGKLFDVCACVIFDGEQDHVGYSCAWELPEGVTRKVLDEKKNLTEAFNECSICNDPDIGDKGGVLAVMTGYRVTRPQYTKQSIEMALLTLNPLYYKCSVSVPPGINDKVEGGLESK